MKILVVTDKYTSSRDLSNGIRIGQAFKSLGHGVLFMTPEEAAVSTKLKYVDFILAIGSLLYKHRMRLAEQIAKNKKPKSKFAIWIFDSCSEIDAPSITLNVKIKRILPYIDLLITTDHVYPWENYISNYLHLFQGIDPEDFRYEPSNNKERPFDVIFAGDLHERYPERAKTLRRIGMEFKTVVHSRVNSRKMDGLPKVTLKDLVYGKSFFDAHQQAKIAFVPRPPSMVKGNYWSNRIYMATATGSCCLVEYVEGMENEFSENKEVFFLYNNKNIIEGIKYLLANPKFRINMGQNARRKTLKNYKYTDRVKSLLRVL